MYHISAETKLKIYEKFGRTEKSVQDDVHSVKNWLKTQRHLPEMMSEAKIRNFLNLNKFSIEKTKQKIDMYYTMRGLIPDWFDRSNPKLQNMQRALDQSFIGTHPKALDGIYRVYLVKNKRDCDVDVEDNILALIAIFEMRLEKDFISEDILIVDMENVTFNVMMKCTPNMMSKTLAVYQKVYSLRMKKIYFINSPSFISSLLTLLKGLMKPKIFERIQVSENSEVLSEVFSKEDLPGDYGGQGPSLNELTEMTRKKFADYQERFDLLDTLRVDESLRPEKLNNDEVLGYYGNFKKLDVD